MLFRSFYSSTYFIIKFISFATARSLYKRRLAYPINDEEEGVYTVINFTSEPSFPAELDRVYKITEGVMRSLIIAHEE